MKQVQMRVDEEGALRNGRFAFTNRYTLVTELLQNARRAGATSVDIEYDEASKVLRVIDDGKGIEDFQTLLLINKSGWDEETRAEESPFGVGFSKCIYSATRVVVTSRCQRIDFETHSALSQAMIDVVDAEPSVGTIVELHGVALPFAPSAIKRLVRGFPIPVQLNGQELPRPYALDAEDLDFVDTEIGKVHLGGTQTGHSSCLDVVFLQGFCVIDDGTWGRAEQVNVVHLDSRKFLARLPDRDKLIDEEEQCKLIYATMKRLWRVVLEERKRSLNATTFCSQYFGAASSWGSADVFDDIPLLPATICEEVTDYPYQSRGGRADYLTSVHDHISREAIERGQVRLFYLDDPEEENILLWMLVRACGHILVNHHLLASGHWAHAYIPTFENASVSATPGHVSSVSWFLGSWVSGEVVMCDAYTITVDGKVVEIADEATVHEGRFLVPTGEHSGRSCLQMSDCMDEYEDIHMEDIDALADFICRLRAVDPEQTVKGLIRNLNLEKYPVLRGKTFRLSVGTDQKDLVLELVA